jgi:hypothetical protein
MAENGPWDADNTQQFIRPLIDNLTAVLQAGEAAVHTEVNGGEPMPAYRNWRRSRWIPLVLPGQSPYPACSVIARRTTTEKGQDGPIIGEEHVIEILIEDVGANPDTLADTVMKRIQAAHLIIERSTTAALFAGYNRRQFPTWDIVHDYAQFVVDKTTYKQNGSLIITFTGLMEKT